MSRTQLLHMALAIVLVFGTAGCTTDSAGDSGGKSGSTQAGVPEAFVVDEAAAKDLEVTADGGGAGVSLGEAYAAVYVPAGAAESGSTWRVMPLTEAPGGAPKATTTGIYVDTAGAEPTDWCTVGFSLPGTVSEDTTIVKLADDGTVSEIVPTTRLEYGERTLLTGYVDGFSAYTTSEEDAAARDKAFVDQAEKKGQQVDWTIKIVGQETQDAQGWQFVYDLDIFASGGGVGMGGVYKGTCLLSMTGKYAESFGMVQGLGDVSGGIRNDSFQMVLIDYHLADLLTGQTVGEPTVSSTGYITGEGFGSLNISATAPNVQGEYHSGPVSGSEPLGYTLLVNGEDVQFEIPGVGIFPGKILRTTK